MDNKLHLDTDTCRWLKARFGLIYLKDGLAPFCDDVAKQQQREILNHIKQTKKLLTVTCSECDLGTLKPDHEKTDNKCPFGQKYCNCCKTGCKIACRNKVCGAIYDKIITSHVTKAPNWKNTDVKKWTNDSWSIAKCFIYTGGYEQKSSAADTDCAGLLHVIINNTYFHDRIGCKITGSDVFTKVRTYRNEIVHTSTMKLEKVRLDTYIDGMIAVLHDGKELKGKQYVQDTVKKLEELKNEDFIITSQRRECQIVLADMKTLKKNIDKGLEDINNSIEGLATKDACEKLERQISTLESIVSKLTEEVKRLGTDNSADKEQSNYENLKKDLQKRLIKLYKKDVLRMSAMPLEQESDLNDFEDVYVRPRMTIAKKDKKEDKKEVDVLSMSDIFTNDDESIKSVYVLGEAGSGKSSFL
ncbi:uncharacterized protein LOC128558976 isoform X2 [Mercenaria mercenaria]|nr:uncharacterized protein LOC128558976 isoform X2 [Mercenaria mercenaria]XP_053405518.1 uncharacterized protein LOC128558976 isoform X2 [Mercenaria mercenaria]XP_053405519.1 uncharacterized protein LOC128558976 isoform X2 [Mercenaria mercenaria]XP_053405520.1 uncharacterized protein LOC128558976 isoform X2 [Mercenaria mercenaria]